MSKLNRVPQWVINSVQYLYGIINRLPHALFWKDVNSVFLGCNEQFVRDSGFQSASEVIGKTDRHMPWKIYADKYIQDDLKVMREKSSILDYEEHHVTSDGSIAIVLVSKVPLYDAEGNVDGILGIFTDITTLRKKMEASLVEAKEVAEIANQSKIDFIQNMRHDIRTPIVGIIGCAHMLQAEANTPILHDYADKLVTASEAFIELLNRIVGGVQMATGRLPIRQQKFALLPQLQVVLDTYQATAFNKGLQLLLDYDPSIPYELIGEPDRIQRIVLELVANACKYTESGYVKVSVSLLNRNGKSVLKLQVADSGIGIPTHKQREVFNKFTRLTPASQGLYEGIGLGLSNVKQFLEELSGEVVVESSLGVGSIFTCYIPVGTDVTSDTPKPSIALADKAGYESVQILLEPKEFLPNQIVEKGTRCRILVVEDDPLSARIAMRFLTRLGCTVDCAVDGPTIFELFKNHVYDLIFMDIRLPDVDGFTLVKRIQETAHFRTNPIPIVALTAYGDEETKRQCLASGMNAALVKPLLKTTAQEILKALIPKWCNSESWVVSEEKGGEISPQGDLTGQVINFERAMALHEGDTLFIKEALSMIRESLVVDCQQLYQACQARDWGILGLIIHRLQGITGYFGLERLEQVALRILQAIEQHPELIQQNLYPLLVKEVANLHQSCQEWLQGQKI